jgi:hypothetical protein
MKDKENVNHPKHYNSHPAGIECIDIIRHYTCDIANALKYLWRAGLKAELGKDDADKEIEDLKKALWYIEDYNDNFTTYYVAKEKRIKAIVREVTDHSIEEITHGYEPNVCEAMGYLLQTGIIREGEIRQVYTWKFNLKLATRCIQDRILDIEMQLTNKELQSTIDVLHGKAVEGEDYVVKPGGVRETEPDKYDPLNMMIIYGRAYCLTDEVRKKDNGALYGPCDNCALTEFCVSNDGTESLKNLCNLHYANDQQYYREVGYCKYRPYYGTIEVVDVQKEHELELKQLEEALNKEG